MAGGFELLAAYVSLSTKGFNKVRTELLRLKALTAQLSGTTILDLDSSAAVSQVKKVKEAITQVQRQAANGKSNSDFLGVAASSSARKAADVVKDLRVKLRESKVPSDLKATLGIDAEIRGFEKKIAALKEQIVLQKQLGNIKAASAIRRQIDSETKAFDHRAKSIVRVAAEYARSIETDKRVAAAKESSARAEKKAADEAAKNNDEAVRAMRRRVRSAEQVRKFDQGILDDARKLSDKLKAIAKKEQDDEVAKFYKRVRIAEKVRKFNQQVIDDEDKKVANFAKSMDKQNQAEVSAFYKRVRRAEQVRKFNQQIIDDQERLAKATALADLREFRRKIRIAEDVRRFNEKVQNDQIKATENSRQALSSLNTGTIGGISQKLAQVSQAIKTLGNTPNSTKGFLGSIGKYSRALGGLVSLMDGMLPILDTVGIAIAAIGTAMDFVIGIFTFGIQVISSIIGAVVGFVSILGRLAAAIAGVAGRIVGFIFNAAKPFIDAIIEITFPIKGLLRLIGDVQRRMGPFIASFLAFKGIAAIANEVAEFELNIARAANLAQGAGLSFAQAVAVFSDAAADLAAKTRFSTGEVSSALLELVKAGFTAEQALGTLEGALQLATLSGDDVASSTRVMAGVLEGFGLRAKDTTRLLNAMLTGINNSTANLSDLGLALTRTGTTARFFDIGLEETTALLTALADKGIRGEKAATAISRGFERLVSPTKKVQHALAVTLGSQGKNIFDFFNQQGQLKNGRESLLGLVDTLNRAHKAGKLTNTQLHEIFGTHARDFASLFQDTEDKVTGKIVSAREKLEAILALIDKNREGNLGQDAVERESGTWASLTQRLKGLFSSLGQVFDKFFGLSGKQVMIDFITSIETLLARLENLKAVAVIVAAIKYRFVQLQAAIAPVIGFILRLNLVLGVVLVLAISRVIQLLAGPFLAALKRVAALVLGVFGLNNVDALNTWSGTISLIQLLITNFNTFFAIAMGKIQLYVIKAVNFILIKFIELFKFLTSGTLFTGVADQLKGMLDQIASFFGRIFSHLAPSMTNVGKLLGLSLAKGILTALEAALFTSDNPILKGLAKLLDPLGTLGLKESKSLGSSLDGAISQATAATMHGFQESAQGIANEVAGVFNQPAAFGKLDGLRQAALTAMLDANKGLVAQFNATKENVIGLQNKVQGVNPNDAKDNSVIRAEIAKITAEGTSLTKWAQTLQAEMLDPNKNGAMTLEKMRTQDAQHHGQNVKMMNDLIRAVSEIDSGLTE